MRLERIVDELFTGALPLVDVSAGEISYVLMEDGTVQSQTHEKTERVIAPGIKGDIENLTWRLIREINFVEGEAILRVLRLNNKETAFAVVMTPAALFG